MLLNPGYQVCLSAILLESVICQVQLQLFYSQLLQAASVSEPLPVDLLVGLSLSQLHATKQFTS